MINIFLINLLHVGSPSKMIGIASPACPELVEGLGQGNKTKRPGFPGLFY